MRGVISADGLGREGIPHDAPTAVRRQRISQAVDLHFEEQVARAGWFAHRDVIDQQRRWGIPLRGIGFAVLRFIAMNYQTAADGSEVGRGDFVVSARGARAVDRQHLVKIAAGVVSREHVIVGPADLASRDRGDLQVRTGVCSSKDLVTVDHQIAGVGLGPLQVHDVASATLG